MEVNSTASSSVMAVSTSMPRAAKKAPTAVFPLLPIWLMGLIIPEVKGCTAFSRAYTPAWEYQSACQSV